MTRGAIQEARRAADDESFLIQLDLRATSVLGKPEPEPEAAPAPPTETPPPDPEPLAEVEPEPTPEPVTAMPAPVPEPQPSPVVTSLAEEAPVVAQSRVSEETPPSPGEAVESGSAPAAEAARPSVPVAPAPVTSPAAASTGTGAQAGLDGLDDGLHLRALRADRPEYPEAARRRNEEGAVTCRLTIESDGSVIEVEVIVSSGSKSLDAAAVRALKRWRFEPLVRLTDRKRVHALQKLSFELKNVRS